MSQRSPHNARYQKYTKPSGTTRRSAASAKPKRDVGKTATGSGSSGKKTAQKRSPYGFTVTPEYRKWRNVWWVCLGVSLLAALAYLLLGTKGLTTQGKFALLIVCYVFLGVGMYIDWRKVRPARQAAMSRTATTAKPQKPSQTSKDHSAGDGSEE